MRQPWVVPALAAFALLLGACSSGEQAPIPQVASARSTRDVVDGEAGQERQRPHGVYFGLWQMTEKMNLAAAAGIALPLLGFLGYQPGTDQPKGGLLSVSYALLPCAIKLAAAMLLWAAPLDEQQLKRRIQKREGVQI